MSLDAAIPTRTRWLIAAMLLIAAMAAGYLLSLSLRGDFRGVPGCGALPGVDCGHVLSSKWSRVWGVPVSAPAIAVYVIALAALRHLGPREAPHRRRVAWRVVLPLGAAMIVGALWFIGLQALLLRSVCPYCIIAHIAGLVAGGLIVSRAIHAAPGRGTAALVLLGIAVVVPMAVAQVISQPIAVDRPVEDFDTGPGPKRVIAVLNGKVRLQPTGLPILGSTSAKVIVLSLADYTCPNCALMHEYLDAARKKYGDQLAVIVLPVPLDSRCNQVVVHTDPAHRDACELARLALAVWRASPHDFEAFDTWLFASDQARSLDEARRKAADMIGLVNLQRRLSDPWVDDQIGRDVQVYRLAGGGALPKVIGPGMVVAGLPGDVGTLLRVMEETLPVTSPSPEKTR